MIREIMNERPGDVPFRRILKVGGLVGGPVLALVVYALLPDRYVDVAGKTADFTLAGRTTTAIAAWMAVWWLTEATHITVTALLPIVLFPLLGARTITEATAP